MESFQSTGIEGYLRDESGLTGKAEAIVFPANSEELQNALQTAGNRNLEVTFQGGRTGICGGAVPFGGLIINFSRMNKALDFCYDPDTGTGKITVQSGFILEDLRLALDKKQLDTGLFNEISLENWNKYRKDAIKLWFLPNPSEKTATLGGIACTGTYVAAEIHDITLILSDGRRLFIRHGDKNIDNIPVSDPIESICGSEGIFGAVAELSLVLHKKPPAQYGFLGYFSTYSQIPLFMKKLEMALRTIPAVEMPTIDFFDSSYAAFITKFTVPSGKALEELRKYPKLPPNTAAALWLELGGSEESLFAALGEALTALEQSGAMANRALAAAEGRDFERLGRLQHLLTEAANLADAGFSPLVADITVPFSEWLNVISFITATLKKTGLTYTLMGHLSRNSISLRFPGIQPSAKNILTKLLEVPLLRQCRCKGDHGIGRVKKEQFRLLNPREEAAIVELKKKLDPAGRINSGIMVDIRG